MVAVLGNTRNAVGKYIHRMKSFERSAPLEAEKQKILDNKNKSEEFTRFLEIENLLKDENRIDLKKAGILFPV